MSNRLDKSRYFYCMLGNPKASFGTISAELHRIRRSALNPFFSQQAVSKFSTHIQAIVNRFVRRIETCTDRGESIPLSYAYRCVTVDIISEYIFGHQFNLLDRPDWGREFYSAWRSLWELSPTIRQFPWMLDAFMAMPRWLTALINSKALEVVDLFTDVDEQTKILLSKDPDEIELKPHPTVVWELSKTDILPPSEKTFTRLAVEANGLLAAGFETTGSVLAHTTYLVLAHPDVHRKLLAELIEAIPNPEEIPGFQHLEQLPYLRAVVKEGLRWIGPLAVDGRLEQYILAFGRGTRSCVGINLAYAEIYTILATLFRKFPQIQLHNTAPRDVEHVHDYFAGMTRSDSQGLQVNDSAYLWMGESLGPESYGPHVNGI
ncbi:hypothetical protein UA08_04503 [Talaromyces atroroseus]|uniref:Trichodiene oxygenase n=1 Tax=Talaromyces atroroseus TaxID=1441469 RepID=A0A225AEQ3_TALAT|nr:hypothetical protein UA08_04503 [Talaromyces atroroseus]OKL59761.1 hypothetical protein UA08_04503 [Talaromyces atroroseus]